MKIEGTHKEIQVLDTVELMQEAQNILIVPGYGLCVAKAQYPIAELVTLLKSKGKNVKFGIHPVAGNVVVFPKLYLQFCAVIIIFKCISGCVSSALLIYCLINLTAVGSVEEMCS